MKIIKILLFPFAIIYDVITRVRNFCYDNNILKSYKFNIPIICVGNLNVGGTGKTPQIEYLIRLLSNKYQVATLSRGYKRESRGFILANENSNAKILGDEPFQFFSKFNNIQVAVDSNRKNGIESLLLLQQKPQIILLDDAFQHRKVKAGLNILLTTFSDLYKDDFILPTGNLRESKIGANRANIIIVTKCYQKISELDITNIKAKLNLNKNQQLFFSYIDFDEKIYSENNSIKINDIVSENKLLIAGIANPNYFFSHLKSNNNNNDETLKFPDHHNFTDKEITEIKYKSQKKIIITTEKDYVRLKNESIENLYYLPIKSSFVNNSEIFDQSIFDFISKHISK